MVLRLFRSQIRPFASSAACQPHTAPCTVKKSLGQIVNPAVTLNPMNHMHATMPPEAATALEMHRLTQLQQHLETAAVLMDISKKVIISPPSSNPQSPGLSDHQNVKMTIKRSSADDIDAIAAKRMKNAKGNNVTTTVYQLNADADARSAAHIKSEHSEGNRYDSDNESNDTDPGRLQMDISSSHDNDDGCDANDALRCSSSPVKLVYKHNRSYNNNTMSGRETPESNKSDDHRTDPATTQLWQALARSTGTAAMRCFFCVCAQFVYHFDRIFIGFLILFGM